MDYYIHQINPILLDLGPLQVRWYGLMYLVAYFVGYLLLMNRYKKGLNILNSEGNQALITYIMIGMIIGARLVYVAVYNPMYYMHHPSEIIAVWQGGLSFHGAALGYIVATLLFCKHYKIQFYHIMDNIVVAAALGITFGRFGNFINGELYGRIAHVPWAVIFPSGGPEPRHPSQLYQAFGEGFAVFLILLLIQKREQKKGFAPALKQSDIDEAVQKNKKLKIEWHRTGVLACSFLILYGVARFIVEFFREPDAQLGFFAQYFSMGQILCFLMIIAGSILLRNVIKNPRQQSYYYELLPKKTK